MKVLATMNVKGAKISENDIFRLHRSEKIYRNNGGAVQQTFVRFKNWSARTRVYRTRSSGERKRDIFVKFDLTKRRLALLKRARVAIEGPRVRVLLC